MTKRIPLTQGKFALVDDEDYDFLMQWKWNYDFRGYARRLEYLRVDGKNPKRTLVLMHRVINKTPAGMDTDHIDGNRLNNQRHNLRSATRAENLMNQKKPRGKGKFKGVYWFKRCNVWRVQITHNGIQMHIGTFPLDQEKEAALCYNKKATELFGEFARLNVI